MVIIVMVKCLATVLVSIVTLYSTVVVGADQKYQPLYLLDGPFNLKIARTIENVFANDPEQTELYLRRAICMNNIKAVEWIFEHVKENEVVGKELQRIFGVDSILDYRLRDFIMNDCQLSNASLSNIRNSVGKQKVSVIDIGYFVGYEELTKLLFRWKLKHIDGCTRSLYKSQVETKRRLFFETCWDVNGIKDNYGNTLLHIACYKGELEMVKLLITNPKVNVNLENNLGHTAIMEASNRGYLAIVKVLLDKSDLDLGAKDKNGNNILHMACCNNQLEIASMLIDDYRINVNLRNNLGYVAMLIASYLGHLDIVQVLLTRKDLNINIQNNDGDTILHMACRYNKLKVIELLLSDPRIEANVKNNEQNTAMMIASAKGYFEILQVFEQYGSRGKATI